MVSRKNYYKFFKDYKKAKSKRTGPQETPNLKNKKILIYNKSKSLKVYPKVSIITYVYCSKTNGRLRQLKENIESISSQKYPSYEHIIVDDGSEIDISEVKNFPNVIYYKKDHTGITNSTKTFNFGLKRMTGKYGMILSSDDVHLSNTILTLVNFLEKHSNYVAVTGNVIHQTLLPNGTVKSQRMIIKKDSLPIEKSLLSKNCVNACATMFRKDSLDKIELPPDQTGFAADYDLWVRLSEVGKFFRLPNMLIKYRNFGNATRIITQKDMEYRNKCISFVKRMAKQRRLNK